MVHSEYSKLPGSGSSVGMALPVHPKCTASRVMSVQYAHCCPLRCLNVELSPLRNEETKIKQQ